MKKSAFLVFLLWAIACFGQSEIAARKFSPEVLRQDVDYLFNKLESIHPDLYHYTPKSEVAEARAILEKELTQPMTRLEFARKAIPVISMLKNGHTSLSFPQEELATFYSSGGTVFPFAVLIRGNRIFVAADRSADQTVAPFTEILSINGIQSAVILDRLRHYISAELDTYRDIRVQDEFGSLFRYVYGFDQEYAFELSRDGKTYVKTIAGLPQKEIRAALLKNGTPNAFKSYYYSSLGNGIGMIQFPPVIYPGSRSSSRSAGVSHLWRSLQPSSHSRPNEAVQRSRIFRRPRS